MKILLLPGDTPALENKLRSISDWQVHLGNEDGLSPADFDCVVRDVSSPDTPLPAWWDEKSPLAPLLVIGEGHSELPYLPPEAISAQSLRAAVDWARQNYSLVTESQAAQTRGHQILAQVTHELRSPITVISLATQLCQSPSLPPEKLASHLGMIRESSKALQGLVDDILDFSKLATGKLELSSTEFKTEDFLRNVCGGYRLLAAAKNVELVSEVDPRIPGRVIGDPGRLRQVLANLLSNAVKFTSEGQIVVRARVLSTRFSTLVLEFSVTDSGIGIPESALSRIFLPYEQADETTFHQFGGTGLGLTITQSLVQRMGGEISVRSRVTEGSTFTFTVKLGRVKRTETDTSSDGLLLKDVPVLLVRESVENDIDLRRPLEEWGCKVWTASEKLDALRMAPVSSGGFIVVKLDEWGFDFAEELRLKSGNPQAQLVLLAASGERGDGARCQKIGASVYLTGNLNAEVFKHSLNLALTTRQTLITKHTVRERCSIMS